jgi:hypothetical protein
MVETLAAIRRTGSLGERVEEIERLMLKRGMKPADAAKRLARALSLADGDLDWEFEVAWEIAYQTIYWPHNTEVRRLERECLFFAREAFRDAWHGLPSRLERLHGALSALEEARSEMWGRPGAGELVG